MLRSVRKGKEFRTKNGTTPTELRVEELQNGVHGETSHCFTYPDFNVYFDRLVLLMPEVNKNDLMRFRLQWFK